MPVRLAGADDPTLTVELPNTTAPSQQDPKFGQPTITGIDLPAMPSPNPTAPQDDAAYGLIAPEVAGQSVVGIPIRLAHDGTPKASVFLAHWCPHCQAEVPRVAEWLDQTGGFAGVEIYSVVSAVDSGRSNYPPSQWLEREG